MRRQPTQRLYVPSLEYGTSTLLLNINPLKRLACNNYRDIKDDKIFFQNYQKPFRKDRPDNTYGGVIIYVKNNIPCKRRTDLEVDGVESVWLEIRLKNKAVLLGTFYRAPNSSIDVHNKIESSIDLAFDTNIPNIIITGDFNYNYSNISSRRKATSLFDQYGLVQLIDEPTHFTETSD